MSWLSELWRQRREKSRLKRLRRDIDWRHGLRRNLASYVDRHGFQIGDFSYGAPKIHMMWSSSRLIVGKYCSIAEGSQFILGGNHPLDHATTFPLAKATGRAVVDDHPTSRGDIVIGNDVWIGASATILSGVTIGDGAIVGACAVVPSDVPPYAVVVGNPARTVRKRFPDDTIAELLGLRWWDLPNEQVAALQPLLQSSDIQSLIAVLRKARSGQDHAADNIVSFDSSGARARA